MKKIARNLKQEIEQIRARTKDGKKKNIREHLKLKCRRRRFETPPESRVKQRAGLESQRASQLVSGHKLSEAAEAVSSFWNLNRKK